ncbi:MAG: T9SS type A sorting domain-containing protein, partial [Candidatus Eisenbacteria bacterium]|nr:T9SS type A sorting domain-containing protein [Candidatus Eisenbacteria bacterium]
ISYRESLGQVAFNPTFNGIREWDGSQYSTIEAGSTSDGLVEDSMGRLWTMGNYYNLRYYDESGFHPVVIAGWGANVVRDESRPGTVWACANFEVVRSDGDYYFSREVVDLPELDSRHDVLTTVAAGPDGIAWVGSTEGLFRIDPVSGTHQWWHSSNSDLPGDQVTPLVVSPDGLVWFTNFNSQGIEASLVWFDGTQFGTITRAQGLPHAQIWDAEVRTVPGGYEIWLACASRGIAVLTVPMNDPADVAIDVTTSPVVLEANWPNPFTDRTALSYRLASDAEIQLDVFDTGGRLVRTLARGYTRAGDHVSHWDGRDQAGRPVGSGVYYYRLQTPAGDYRHRMTLIR